MNDSLYYTEDQWNRALATLQVGFQLLSKEYHPTKFGKLKNVSCYIFEQGEHFLPGTTIRETAPVRVVWKHNGACYKGQHPFVKYDLVSQLKAIAKEDVKLAHNSKTTAQ